ncbi:hypothetical protein V1525DRAFT_360066 [Lipomyces kononenkoae]|uniref:Uncharacterized protein n=1 Tax=Lipomyces kononenkoae TaxID=34357 RepID=A0ACC3T2E3_LIPKO
MAFHQTIFYPLMRGPPHAANIDQVSSVSQPSLYTTTTATTAANGNGNGRPSRSPSPTSRRSTLTTATSATLVAPARGSTMSKSVGVGAGVAVAARQAQEEPTAEAFVTFLVADIDGLRYLRGSDAQYVNRIDGKPKITTVTGYEVYIIEQWACARYHNSSLISYTGNPEHVASLGSITVPTDRERWSKRLRAYVDDLSKMNARPKTCGQCGTLFVTNLSSLQSGLTLINVIDGKASMHINDFIVNENLRRMGCGGRSGITLNKPADASRDKFYQIYRLSDRVPFENAVINIVKLVQVSLYYFGLFKRHDIDGLLCDFTERAVNAWWHEVGIHHYHVDPVDKVLGPTTIAAILGMVVGCRHRLNAAGAQVAKDPFDVEGFRQGIVTFQRQQKLERTARLDKPTLHKLLRITGKISSSARFPLKVVKSTVQDLSGMHTQNAIDVETTDYDRFIENIYGHSLRYLWLGKMNSKFARQIKDSKFANVIDEGGAGYDNPVPQLVSPAVHALAPSNSNQPPRRPPPRSAPASSLYRGEDAPQSSSSAAITSSASEINYSENKSDQDEDDVEESENYDPEGPALIVTDTNDYSSRSSLHVPAYDDNDVPAFVRYHRSKRSNRDQTQPVKRDLRTAMRRGKVRTDEAIRSGVSKLTGNLRRRRDELYQTPGITKGWGSKRVPELAENDNVPLSTGTSIPPSTATDGSTPPDEGKQPDELDLLVPEREYDDELEEESEYDLEDDDIEESEYLDPVLSRSRTQPKSASRTTSDLGGDERGSSNEPAGSATKSFSDDSERLNIIARELMLYHGARTGDLLPLGPRTVKSCFDMVSLARQHISKAIVALGGISASQQSARVCPLAGDVEDKLVRRASFSVVENVVLRSDAPWDYPTEHIFRLLERVKRAQQWSESHVKRAENLRDEYADQVADLTVFYEHASNESEAVQQVYQHAVQREGYLANGIRDLDMETARLQYEVRTLDAKLHDLDESVDSFGAKVEGMESRLQALCQKPIKGKEQLNGKEKASINGENGKH